MGRGADLRIQSGRCLDQRLHVLHIGATAAAEDTHAALCHLFHIGGKLFRGAVINGLPIHHLRHTGIGLCDQRDRCVFLQPAQLSHHLVRAGGAVETEGIHAHSLQNHQRSGHIRSGKGLSVLVTGKGDKHRLSADAFDCQHRRAGLRQRHLGLDHKEIHAGLFHGRHLFGIDLHQILKGGVTQRIHEFPGGGDISRHPGAVTHRILADGHQLFIVFRHLVENTVTLQFGAVGTECGSVHHLAAGFNVTVLHLRDHLGVLQDPILRADAAVKAPLLQLGAGGSVQNQGIFQFHGDSSLSNVICSGNSRLKALLPDSSR